MSNAAPTDRPDGADDTVEATVALVKQTLDRGEPLVAYDRAQAGLARWPGHTRLRQLKGLALARGGDMVRANQTFAELAQEGNGDAETLGMLARTCKDLGLRAKDPAARAAHLGQAFGLYEKTFEAARRTNSAADALYGGINAATLAVLLGDLPRAQRIAAEVQAIGQRTTENEATQARYWREATLGESALILGEPINLMHLIGVGIIFAGVVVVGLSERRANTK